MGILKYFVKPEQDDGKIDLSKKKPITNQTVKVVNTIPSSSSPTVIIATDGGEYDKLFKELIDKRNQPGPDFLEFQNSLEGMSNKPLTDEQKYQIAFGALSTMGLTKAKIISSSSDYLLAISQEESEFKAYLKEFEKKNITDREALIEDTNQNNLKLQKQMEENNLKINKLRTEIQQDTINKSTKEQQFNIALTKIRNKFAVIIENVNKYL